MTHPFTDGIVGNIMEMRVLISYMLHIKVLPKHMKSMANLRNLAMHFNILGKIPSWICGVEAIPLHKINEDVVISFLQDHIMTRFGVPVSVVFDNATYFSSIKLTAFAHEKGIKLHYSANYYPQGNGLAESTTKI